MQVDVLQEHIDEGIPGEEEACALALAFLGAGFVRASVDTEQVQLWKVEGGAPATYDLSREAQCFVAAFDNQEDVLPERIVLTSPGPRGGP